MKKRILLGFLVILAVCGCGNQKANTDKEAQVSEFEQILEEEVVVKTFEAKEEILNANLGSGLIQIGDTIVSIPTKVKEVSEQTNAEYMSIDYNPDIMSDEFLVSADDGAVIAGLYFPDAECTAVYYSEGIKEGASSAGDLYMMGLREIRSENIFLPKGIKVGMTLTDMQETFGDALEEGYTGDEETLEYKVRFLIDDQNVIDSCAECYTSYSDKACPSEFCGFLYMDINRNTGVIQELSITLGYDASTN